MSDHTADQIPELARDIQQNGTPYRSMKGPMLAALLHSITLKDWNDPAMSQEFRTVFNVTKKNGVDMTNAMDAMDIFVGTLTPAEVTTMKDMKLLYAKFLHFGANGPNASWGDNCKMRYSQLRAIAAYSFQAND